MKVLIRLRICTGWLFTYKKSKISMDSNNKGADQTCVNAEAGLHLCYLHSRKAEFF